MAILAASEKEFIELFNTIEDPREDGKVLYPLSEILLGPEECSSEYGSSQKACD